MTLLYWLFCFSAVSIVSGFVPATYPVQTPAECSTGELLVDKELMETLKQVQQQLGPPGCNPPRNRSCQNILYCFPSAPSGYYQITTPNSSLVQVYCDMEGTNCGREGGWTRVAYVNMSQSGTTCPQGLTQRILTGKNYCGRNIIGCQKCLPYTWSQLLPCVWTAKSSDAFASIIELHISCSNSATPRTHVTYVWTAKRISVWRNRCVQC